jgi:Glycosyltransferase Family 4
MVSEHASPLAPVGGPDSGGQNVHVAALAVALRARGHDVAVLTGPAALDGARGGAFPVVQTFHALRSVKRRYQKGADASPASRIRLEGQIARQADAIIATCTDEVTELDGYGAPPGTVFVVPCGVDTWARVAAETEAGYERLAVVASRPAAVADRA